jgi:hypothetical protein
MKSKRNIKKNNKKYKKSTKKINMVLDSVENLSSDLKWEE